MVTLALVLTVGVMLIVRLTLIDAVTDNDGVSLMVGVMLIVRLTLIDAVTDIDGVTLMVGVMLIVRLTLIDDVTLIVTVADTDIVGVFDDVRETLGLKLMLTVIDDVTEIVLEIDGVMDMLAVGVLLGMARGVASGSVRTLPAPDDPIPNSPKLL